MNFFLVGNGYDLHHKFPTSYINFLHTITFLIDNKGHTFETVGSVFGNEALHQKDDFIQQCYDAHSQIYSYAVLPQAELADIVERAENNLWFNYLQNCVAKDIHWIDFEREILRVMEAFSEFFNHDNKLSLSRDRVIFDFASFPPDPEDRHILSQFDFFFEELDESRIGRSRMMQIKCRYASEKISGSRAYHLATDDIVSDLYTSLRDLSDILRLYLLYFIDGPAAEYAKLGIKPRFASLPSPNYVYSFNYTNTFEILYSNNMVDHLHGNTSTAIVLGVNPDENDEIGHTDTTFLQFKKYFQRVFYKTDLSFLAKIRSARATPGYNDNTLYVIGHSLDSTDEDIIKQVFDIAKSIIVLYHSDSSVKNQIRNLVKMYGKEGLDELRDKKKLQFLPQSDIQWIYPT